MDDVMRLTRNPDDFAKALDQLSEATGIANEAKDAAQKAESSLAAEDARLKAAWAAREDEVTRKEKAARDAEDVIAGREKALKEAEIALEAGRETLSRREAEVTARENALSARETAARAIEASAKVALDEANQRAAQARREGDTVDARKFRLAEILDLAQKGIAGL